MGQVQAREPEVLLSFAEAAQRLGKSVKQAYWMRDHGDFPLAAKIGGRLMVRESDLASYIERKFQSA